MSTLEFGLFFFNSEDSGISGNYAAHAKHAVARAVAEGEPRVLRPDERVLSGDLFAPANVARLLGLEGLAPEATDGVRAEFGDGRMPAFVPYAIGLFRVPRAALRQGHHRMTRERVAGYRGLAMFTLPQAEAVAEISEGLGLPSTSLHSI